MHGLRGWGTITWVTTPPPSALPLSPVLSAPALPTTSLVVVSTTSLKVMSLLVPAKLWWEIPIVVWGTKHWDGGYIVAHGVVLLIVLLKEQNTF